LIQQDKLLDLSQYALQADLIFSQKVHSWQKYLQYKVQQVIVTLTHIGDIIAYNDGLHFCCKCIHIEIRNRFNLIHERECTGETVSIILQEIRYLQKELLQVEE
jgi:hypothetical protein